MTALSPLSLRAPLEEVNVLYRLVDQFAKGDQRIPRTQGRPAGQIRSRGRQHFGGRDCDFRSALANADLANPAAVYPEIRGNVMLAIAAHKHPFDYRNLLIVERHLSPHCVAAAGGKYSRTPLLMARAP